MSLRIGPLAVLLLYLPLVYPSNPVRAQSPAKPGASAVPVAGTEPGVADSPAYAKEGLIVLDHTALTRFTADGLGERTDTMRIKMKSDAAVRALGVLTIPYASLSEHVEVVYLRVRKPDGTVVATSDQDAQEADGVAALDSWLGGKLLWPSAGWAVAIGAAFLLALIYMEDTSRFLYFQF
jgi:hypothetical protein